MDDNFFLLGAGLLAGAMNGLAGGGSFVTLPVMIHAGMPSVSANASSTVALYPGSVASAWVYRGVVTEARGVPVKGALLATLVGGLIGALLLLWTPSSVFDRVLPWLLLVATFSLAFGSRTRPILRARVRVGAVTVLAVQVLLGIYGGYFGGAVGLLMLAAWSLLDDADVKTLNAARALMVTAANTVAALCFVIAGAVRWRETLLVAAGAIAGGYGGARLGARLPAGMVRITTLLIAAGMTAAFFASASAGPAGSTRYPPTAHRGSASNSVSP